MQQQKVGWFRKMVMKLLKIQPAQKGSIITIKEPFSYEESVLRNRLWYRGDPSELEQFYKQAGNDNVSRSRFWAAVPSEDMAIRKIHSGLPAMIVERLADIAIADLNAIDLGTDELNNLWQEIDKDNNFRKLLGESIIEALSIGDGAFKITVDTNVTEYPIIEFYSGDRVEYVRERNRLKEIIFKTDYTHKDKDYQLHEIFGKGYIKFKLFDEDGEEVPLSRVPETAEYQDVEFAGNFIMAVPLMFFKNHKWPDRGKSLFDSKADSFDALDEVISQWIDAIRLGRVQKYIPEDLLPRSEKTGLIMRPNPFDNQFIKLKGQLNEGEGSIDMNQPDILYAAFVSTYANMLDQSLQGIISPSTLGIDLKKTDNAEAQREKEKATLYTRGKIIERLQDVIPQLVDVVLKVYDNMKNRNPKDYEVTVEFGEYASPDFNTLVETVGKAKDYKVMSTERAVEELYPDWTEEERAEEVARIKEEEGIISLNEPQVGEFDDPPTDESTLNSYDGSPTQEELDKMTDAIKDFNSRQRNKEIQDGDE